MKDFLTDNVLGREELAGYWWDIYKGASGRLVAVCDELGATIEGLDLEDLAASANEVVSLLKETV